MHLREDQRPGYRRFGSESRLAIEQAPLRLDPPWSESIPLLSQAQDEASNAHRRHDTARHRARSIRRP